MILSEIIPDEKGELNCRQPTEVYPCILSNRGVGILPSTI